MECGECGDYATASMDFILRNMTYTAFLCNECLYERLGIIDKKRRE